MLLLFLFYSNNTDLLNDQLTGIIKKFQNYPTGAYSELVRLVVMTNVFFNYQQNEIQVKRLICVRQIVWFLQPQLKPTYYSFYTQNVKTNLYRKLNFQPNLTAYRFK